MTSRPAAKKKGPEPVNLDDLLQRHAPAKGDEDITFAEYFALVQKDPSLARLSHARLYGMLTEN